MTEARILIGPPAVGKGEVLRKLQTTASVHSIEVKALLLAKMASDPDFKKTAEDEMASGGLVSDGIVNQLLEEALSKTRPFGTVVIDGSCRTLAQTKFLRWFLLKNHFEPTFVIFSISEDDEGAGGKLYELCRSRVQNRVSESRVGDERPDDRLEIHRHRFDVYASQIDHIEAYLLRKGCHIHFVDPRGTKEEVFSRVFINMRAYTGA